MASNSWITPVSGDWSTAGNWSAGVPTASQDVLIGTDGTYTVTASGPTSAGSITLDAAGATLDAGGSFGNTNTLALGGLLQIQAGTLALGGVIAGGTIETTGGTIEAPLGAGLSGVTTEGTLVLSTGLDISVTNGLTLEGAGGIGSGAIDLSNGLSLDFVGSQTLSGGSIVLGPAYFPNTDEQLSTVSGTLTLASGVIVQAIGSNASMDGSFVNQGTILANTAGAGLSVGGYGNDSLANQGVISISNGDQLNVSSGCTLANAGTLALMSGGALYLSGSLTNTGSFSAAGGMVVVAGGGTSAELQQLIASGAAVELVSYVDNSGGKITLGASAGSGTLTLDYGGVIHGGVIQGPSAGLILSDGTLDGVTYDGTLAATPNLPATIVNGITLAGAGGNGPGVLDITGGLVFGNTQAITSGTIDVGNATNTGVGIGFPGLDVASGSVLTLGSAVVMQQTGAAFEIGGSVVNQGMMKAAATAGKFAIDSGATLTNQGTLAIGSGEVFVVNGSLANAGSLIVAAGGTLDLLGSFANTGSISAAGGTVVVGGQVTQTELASLAVSGASLVVTGTLDNTGGTLQVGAGSALGALTLGSGGVIRGGVVQDSNAGLVINGGTLDGVTYDGRLAVTGGYESFPSATILDGITLAGSGGSGPGELDITGGLLFANTQTIASGTIDVGGGYASAAGSGIGPGLKVANGSVLTLGPAIIMQQTGAAFEIGGSVVNQGLMKATATAGQFAIDSGATLTNQGTLAIGAGEMFMVNGSLANAGSLIVAAGGTLDLLGSFANTGSFSAAGGTIVVGGQVTQAELASLASSGGTVVVTGTLDNTGGTLQVGAGSTLGALTLGTGGVIRGGLIQDAGGGLIGAGGTLDGVTFNGTLGLTHARDALTVLDGITMVGAGTINLSGKGAALAVPGGQTLNAKVNIGGSGGVASLGPTYWFPNGGNLTLGPSSVVTQTGQQAGFTSYGGTIVNQGIIQAALADGSFRMDGLNGSNGVALNNAGTINVANGDVMAMGSLANSGQVSVASGGVLTIGQYTGGSSGHLSETNGALTLNGTLDLPSLSTVSRSGGVVSIGGTLDLGGGTLAVGGTTALGQLRDNGVIANGTIADSGGGLVYYGAAGSSLQNITYRGLVNLTPALSNLVVQGLTVTGAGGTGVGAVNVLGAGSELIFQGTQTFNNATINLGSNTKAATLSVSDIGAGGALTLGAGAGIQQRGAMAEIDIGRGFGDALINNGLIAANAANGSMIVLGGTFTNAGKVVIASGDTLSLEADRVSNLAGNLLSGGYWEVDANSMLNLGMDDPITTMNAAMVLNGAGSQVQYYDTTQFRTTSLEQTMHYVGSAGVLVLNNGRAFNDPGLLYDNGQIILGGGTLSAQPLAIGATGVLYGAGTITANTIYDSGHVLAQNGQLVVNAPLLGGSPVGNALIAAGSTLTANNAVNVPVRFEANTGTLALAQAGSMTGTIAGFTGSDAIDLVNVGTAGVSLNYAAGTGQGTLTVKSGTATAAALRFAGTYVAANFRFTSDGHGGTLILDPPVPVTPRTIGAAPMTFAGGGDGAGGGEAGTGSGVALNDLRPVPGNASRGGASQGGTLATGYGVGMVHDTTQTTLLSASHH